MVLTTMETLMSKVVWSLTIVIPLMFLLFALNFSTGDFDRRMNRDLEMLDSRLKESGGDARKADAISSAFRAVQVNVGSFVTRAIYSVAVVISITSIALGPVFTRLEPVRTSPTNPSNGCTAERPV